MIVHKLCNFGVFLDSGNGNTNDNILLHKFQQKYELAIGDKVKIYLYNDPKKRLTASMRLPQISEGQVAYVKIINITNDGAFC